MTLFLASVMAALCGPLGGEGGRGRGRALQMATPELGVRTTPPEVDLSAALSRVDWLAWAAPQEDVDEWLEESLSPQGVFATSLRPGAAPQLQELRGAPVYAVEAELMQLRVRGQEHAVLQVREAVVYTNPAQVPLEGMAFRVFANGQDVYHDRSRVAGVWVDNQPVPFSLDATILSVEFPEPLAPGASTRVLLHLVQDVPSFDPRAEGEGPIEPETTGAFGNAEGVINLGHWLPLVTPVDRRGRFDIRPIRSNTEHAMFDPALFHVVLHVPSLFTVASTGVELHRADDGGQATVVSVAAAARGFAMELVSGAAVLEKEIGGTRVRVTYPADSPSMGRHLLDYAEQALLVFSPRFGPLASAELDIVEAPLYQVLAVEHPELVAIDLAHDDVPYHRNASAEWAVVHEIAHQWWGLDVGNDPAMEPWLDEALAANAASVYWLTRYGEDALEARYELDVLERLVMLRERGAEDLPADLPAWKYDLDQYAAFVFGRGSMFFDRLREAMGEDRFFQALRQYRARYGGRFVSGAELLDCFAEVAEEAGQDPQIVTDLHQHWIREAHSYEELLPR
jgi:hypothetical protein